MTSFMGMITFKCSKCGAIVSFVREEQKAVAIQEWNRRAEK